MKEDIFNTYLSATTPIPAGVAIVDLKFGPLPHYDIQTRTSQLSMGCFAEVTEGSKTHTVLVSYRQVNADEEFDIVCGAKFLEATGLDAVEAAARATDAVTAAGGPASLRADMLSLHATYPASAPCNFWAEWRRSQKLCVHTKALLSHLQQNVPDFKEKLRDGYDAALTASGASIVAPGETMGLEELAFRVPVLFEGDRGAGKTVTARAFARTHNYPKIELAGHEGIEAMDMLGCLVPAPSGQMVWKDGALSEAVRKARDNKVVLIIDELLRIRTRELSILLTTLSPDEGMYRLRTGRIVDVVDGVAQEEELVCPVSNLCVVATTNVGAEYAVDEIDPALAERFVVLRKDTSKAELKRILTIVAKAQKLPAKVVTKCLTFYENTVEANNRGLLARTPTTRTLARALELATDEEGVARALKTQVLLWVARDSAGRPIPEQMEVVHTFLTKVFK